MNFSKVTLSSSNNSRLPGVLYISYDGMLEPLGRSQVVAYLQQLASGRSFCLISYEKARDLAQSARCDALKKELSSFGVKWFPLRYHKCPSLFATSWDVLVGSFVALIVAKRNGVSVVHARGYVASVISLVVTRLTGAAFLFDMRGFWADEKLDGGWSDTSFLYRLAKHFERKFFRHADHVVCLTNAAVPIIQSLPYLQYRTPPITVIPTCADLERFKPNPYIVKPSVLTIGYVGTVTNWYLFAEVAACFAEIAIIKPEARFLIVNRNEHDFIYDTLRVAGVSLSSVELVSAEYHQVPALIARMHASVYFIKPVFSKQGSAATKLAELLGCGVPCLTNSGVGDVDQIFAGERIGIIIRSLDRASLISGVIKLLELVDDPETSNRCVSVASKYFSLVEGAKRYMRIYEGLDSLRV